MKPWTIVHGFRPEFENFDFDYVHNTSTTLFAGSTVMAIQAPPGTHLNADQVCYFKIPSYV